jgi:hypothetical protein
LTNEEPAAGLTERWLHANALAETWAVEYRPSVAVLPFVDPRAEKGQEYPPTESPKISSPL